MRQEDDSKSLIEEAYREIKRLMLHRKLVPGQKLPYRELIDLLQMSKTPIINALNRLEQEGFITSETNRGYMVKPIDPKEVMDAYEVRSALEAKAVQQAVVMGKPADMSLLKDKLHAYEDYSPPRLDQKKLALDGEFHLQIAEISGNKVLKYLLRRNFEHIILRARLELFAPERMISSSKEHRALLTSMKRKDIQKSLTIIEEHVQRARDNMVKSLSQEEPKGLDSMTFFNDR